MKSLISVITVNFNNKEGLKKTIESVISQTYNEIEYIIIDGGSSDGSLEIIKEYSDKISCYVSEPDLGIFNAMNKGVRLANGIYCNFMNSGDMYVDNFVLDKISSQINNADYIVGNTIFEENKQRKIWWNFASIRLSDLIYSSLSHQSSFIRRQLLLESPYDENYKIVSDWKFTIETLVLQNCSFQKIEELVCLYDINGVSNQYLELRDEERQQVIKELFPERIWKDYLEQTDLQKIAWEYQSGNTYRILLNIAQFLLKFKKVFRKR